MGAKIELIFGYAEHTPGQIAVRLKLDGREFDHHRDAGTPEGSRAALILTTNCRKSGFYWTPSKTDPADGVATPVNLFMTDIRLGVHANQARELVDRFRDQGFEVSPTGGYLGGTIYTYDQLVAMDADEFYGHLRDETIYVETRNADRRARHAVADASLRAASAAEARREVVARNNIFKIRIAQFKSNLKEASRPPIEDIWEPPQPFTEGDQEPAFAMM
ncbi:hypothetical protein FY136_28590 (plasmid) [Agrobacterium tumefaciens]|uniref:hypothetical protein n=1 Tax=Agrobacterium tumefaciens TaxID=358 RepID=UPI0021D10E9B|nr:hypothetical protein [Agrobacterium tumefaciens]UXT53222.1 hypothetical protein FY136_28590 [Agrobacterium tumefaciens]